MKTRNSPKPAAKKTPPVKKTTPKPSATEPSTATTTTPEVATPASTAITTPKTTPTTGSKQPKSASAAPTKPSPAPKVAATTPKAEDASASKPTEKKVTPGAKTVVKKKVMKKVAKPTSAKKTPLKEENASESPKKEEVGGAEEPTKKEELVAEEKEIVDETVEESPKTEEVPNPTTVESPKNAESEPVAEKVEEQVDEGEKAVDDTKDAEVVPDKMEEDVKEAESVPDKMEEVVKEAEGVADKMEKDVKEDAEGRDAQTGKEEEQSVEETAVDYGEQEGFQEPGDDECAEDNAEEENDEGEGEEEGKRADEERKEISALADERKSKKEQEIFVGGLDRDTVEEDIKKAFKEIGEVVDVRLHKNPSTNKNKGYAFVKFASKELASKALSELKNPLIRGKRCGVAPSEDNDTLFVGNICNTWTKEAIKKKLTEYGLGGIESITLVADAQHEGLSRGFAFVEFSCHADAMLAYKRLQKPDVIFGHAERTVKVAFAEPLREPDPEIMAQVKSVFIDGLPQHWDEERVREHFKPYGEIERIVLARNMPSAKRKDFGFVDYSTHEAAIACIDGVNNTELGDEKSKSKVKVRLSNPLPKTQAVKGGLSGGFRIGRPSSGFSRFGKGTGQAGRPSNRVNVQRGKDSHPRGRGRSARYAYADEDILESPYSNLRGRRAFGGRGGFAGTRRYEEDFSRRGATSSRPDLGRPRYAEIERGDGRPNLPRRRPISPDERFSRPVGGRHYVDDPYMYESGGHGLKRPYSMLDHEPGYLEPNRLRPRFDHPDPVVPPRETRYQGGSGLYSSDYYQTPPYGSGAYSPMYGGERSYGGGYYY